MALAHELARSPLVEPSTRETYLIPPAERAEVEQQALHRFIERIHKPKPLFAELAGDELDLACRAYLGIVLVRVWIQIMRHRTREPATADETIEAHPISENAQPDAELKQAGAKREARDRVTAIRAILDRVAAHVIAETRGKDAQDRARTTWEQLSRLGFEGASMNTFVDPDSFDDAATYEKKRGAAYAAHSRFRKAMAQADADGTPSAIERMSSSGALTASEAALATAAMVLLLR